MGNGKNNHEKRKFTLGISAISVQGYKSIHNESKIEIRPLTILAGANSSGKSSIMQPLLLLKQTLEASYDPGALLLDGPNVRFTSAEQLLARIAKSKCCDGFAITLEVDGQIKLKLPFKNIRKKGFDIAEMDYQAPVDPLKLKRDMTNAEIMKIIPKELNALKKMAEKRGKNNFEWKVEREFCFLNLVLRSPKNKKSLGGVAFSTSPSNLFEPLIRGVIHVTGLRGNPERNYRSTSTGPNFPGTFENYAASIINHWQSGSSDFLDRLGAALDHLGLTWRVKTRRPDETKIEITVARLPHSTRKRNPDMVNIADVGFGVSQSLPVLVGLLVAKPSQLIYIEQPEIHLHPRAQVALANILLEAAGRGVKVVIETHSGLLLLAIQALVAKGAPAELIKLHWFERDPEGVTKITTADMDKDGSFGDWPQDFWQVELEAEKNLLNSIKISN